jgi:glucosylceramidase
MSGADGAGRRRYRRIVLVLVVALVGCQSPPRVVRPLASGARPPPVTRDQALGSVQAYLTDAAGQRMAAQPAAPWRRPQPVVGDPLVTVDDGTMYQTIDGFGASFLEAGLVTLNSLPTRAAQDAVLRALFDPVTGAGFSVMKTEIGATDFQAAQQKWFTYDDTPGDTALRDFSIARDEGPDGELTYIRRARAFGAFTLEASMDYPPDWMLTALAPLTEQHVDPAAYPVLARYYLKYLQAYRQAGVPIPYLILFNEPGVYTKISSDALNVLLRDHVGPLLRRSAPDVRLVPAELGNRKSIVDYFAPLRADPATRDYTDVLAYHGYWGDGAEAVAQMHAREPGIPLWMTEICCMPDVPGSTDPRRNAYATGEFWATQIIADLNAGASAWLYWNMILDENGGPWLVSPAHFDNDPNAQNAVLHIDRRTHVVTYTPLYWYLAHFSRFVRPGASRVGIAVTGGPPGLQAIAFENLDGRRVLELVNGRPSALPVHVRWQGRQLATTLAAHSISTLVWS